MRALAPLVRERDSSFEQEELGWCESAEEESGDSDQEG